MTAGQVGAWCRNRGWIAALVGGAATGVFAQSPAPAVPEGYRLVWHDEFDGPALDAQRWVYRTTRRGNVSICRPGNVSLADGHLRIACRREKGQPVELTCGGAITAQEYRYGYYEVAVRMHGGAGWHEAFWTTRGTNLQKPKQEPPQPNIEIDCFESYADHGVHKFTYGVIEWRPVHGGVSRDYLETPIDLSQTFNVFGFEFTPEFINFFFNGALLRTVDVRDAPQNPFNLWLSCIATEDKPDMRDGYCDFDYLRCYAIDLDSAEYQRRRAQFLPVIDKVAAPMKPSRGEDLWLQAEDFVQKGAWELQRDGIPRILKGQGDRKRSAPWSEQAARTMVAIPTAGKYRLWVCARDYAQNQPGKRNFQAAVNGRVAERRFGTHGQEGYAWEDGGVFELPEGLATVELIDATRYHARCDRLLLTSDLAYRPAGLGVVPAAAQTWDESRARTAAPPAGGAKP